LTGKVALIIGGTSGIGFAVAAALIEEGAHVIVSSSSQSRVDDAVKRLSDPEKQYNADKSRVQGKVCNLKGPEMEVSRKCRAGLTGGVRPLTDLIMTASFVSAISRVSLRRSVWPPRLPHPHRGRLAGPRTPRAAHLPEDHRGRRGQVHLCDPGKQIRSTTSERGRCHHPHYWLHFSSPTTRLGCCSRVCGRTDLAGSTVGV
jgi:hypothetical protein